MLTVRRSDDGGATCAEPQASPSPFTLTLALTLTLTPAQVRRSDDGGATWRLAYVLEEGPSAYSSMGLLSDGQLGVLYERGDRISFARIPSHPNGPLGEF